MDENLIHREEQKRLRCWDAPSDGKPFSRRLNGSISNKPCHEIVAELALRGSSGCWHKSRFRTDRCVAWNRSPHLIDGRILVFRMNLWLAQRKAPGVFTGG